MTYSQRSLKSFCQTPDVPQRRNRSNFYLKSLATSSSSQPSSTVVLCTGGMPKTSTQDLTTEVPSLVFLRSKMGTVLVDTARLSSLLIFSVNIVLMSARYFLTLTSLDSKYIQVRKEMNMEGYTAIKDWDLIMVT